MVTRVAVLGSGGMGSWFARFFRSRKASVVVSDRDLRKARQLASRIRAEYAPNNIEAARGSDIVVVATPVRVASEVIKEILPALKRNSLLLDICAVKSAVIPALHIAERRGVRIASIHPMFGPLAPSLRGRAVMIVRTGKNMRGTDAAKQLFRLARIRLVDPKAHDKQMAVALALPHFLNMVFAGVSWKRVSEARKYAGRTFNLQLLLAETIASEPETTADIQAMSKEFGPLLRELERQIRQLSRIVYRRDGTQLAAQYRRIRKSLSADPEFRFAQKKFETVCEALSGFSTR